MINSKHLTIGILTLLENTIERYGENAIVHIRADDGGVTIYNVVTNKMLYDADTLVEFVYGFNKALPPDTD